MLKYPVQSLGILSLDTVVNYYIEFVGIFYEGSRLSLIVIPGVPITMCFREVFNIQLIFKINFIAVEHKI